MRSLLDINVLIALLDASHLMHQPAIRWLEAEIGDGWASCPITENGLLRIMSQPSYPNTQPLALIADRFAEACATPEHEFWPENISLISDKLVNWPNLLGHWQITDAYLLALAVKHKGRFVTFDQRLSLDVVAGAKSENLLILT